MSEVIDEAAGQEIPTPAASILEEARRVREQLVQERTKKFDLPGAYAGKFVVEYKMLSLTGDIKIIGDRVNRETKKVEERVLNAAIDSIIAACVEIYWNDGDKLIPLRDVVEREEDEADAPVRYDDRLARFMGLQVSGARDLVFQFFGGNDVMIYGHSQELGEWMRGSRGALDGEYLGNA